jgi:acetyl-CoA carboxylase carboxyl transferase subunit alpha
MNVYRALAPMALSFTHALDFERPLLELEKKIEELRHASQSGSVDFTTEIGKLEKKAKKLQAEIFSDLNRWQVVQLSRHTARPYFLDYVGFLFTDFVELAGDRYFGEDPSIVGGFARLDGRAVMIIGHQKGRSTKENMVRNFGMPRPEGYRKAIRMYEMADRFGLPVLTFIDTPGAYPGIDAEERGQSEAIGAALGAMAKVTVPIVATIIGEGGSGGALALGVANRVLVLEFGCYSVISPEGCAGILWKDGARAADAAVQLKMTAPDLLRLSVVDSIVDEPAGGAHRDHEEAAKRLDRMLYETLSSLDRMGPNELAQDRYERFRKLGAVVA